MLEIVETLKRFWFWFCGFFISKSPLNGRKKFFKRGDFVGVGGN